MEMNLDIYIAWGWNNCRQNMEVLMGTNEVQARKLSQDLGFSANILKSWIESGFGTIINLENSQGVAKGSVFLLENLKKIKEQAEGAVQLILVFGIGHSLEEANDALNIAQTMEGSQVIFWVPPQPCEVVKNNESQHAVPHPKGSVSGWAHRGMPAQPRKNALAVGPITEDDESQNPIEANINEFEHKIDPKIASSDISQILHSHAIKFGKENLSQESKLNLDTLRIKIGRLLLKIKEKVPQIEALQESYPDLYNSYMVLAKAFVDLSKEILKQRGLQKNEILELEEYEDLIKSRFKLGRGMSHLPYGSVFDGRVKIEDKKTGRAKWRSILAGAIQAPDGTTTSSLEPDPA